MALRHNKRSAEKAFVLDKTSKEYKLISESLPEIDELNTTYPYLNVWINDAHSLETLPEKNLFAVQLNVSFQF